MFSPIRSIAAADIIALIAVNPAHAQTRGGDRDTDDGVTCNHYTVPVELASGLTPLKIEGELCSTNMERRSGKTVQLVIHGAATNHAYWDFGTVDGVRYSYARDVAERGIATFAMRRARGR
jgi:hypothetical protein